MTLRKKILLVMTLLFFLMLTAIFTVTHTWESPLCKELEGYTGSLLNQQSAILCTAILVLCCAGIFLVFERMIIRPVTLLRDANLKLESGDISARIPVKGRDEFSDLARAFNRTVLSLENAEQKFRTIFEAFPYPVSLNRLSNGAFIDVNPAFVQNMQKESREELIGLCPADALIETDSEALLIARERLLETGRIDNELYKVIRPDGSEAWIIYSTRIVDFSDEQAALTVLNDVTGLKLAESRLAAQREQLQNITASVPGIVYQFYPLASGEYRMTYVSGSAVELFEPQENIDSFFTQFVDHIHPDDRDEFLGSIRKAVDSVSPWHYEGRFIKNSGEVLWFSGTSNPVRQPDRVLYNGLLLDITKQKEAEEALKLTQFAMDQAPDSILWVDDNGYIAYANDTACSWLGYTRKELSKMEIFDIDPDFPAERWEQFKKDFKAAGRMIFSGRHRRKNGQLFPVEITASYLEQDGRYLSVAFDRDITERIRAEEALKLTQFAMDRAPDSILWVDDNGYIAYANDTACSWLGYTREELSEIKIFNIDPDFPAEEWEQHKNTLQKVKRMIFEGRHRRKNGQLFPVEITTNYIEHNGRFLGIAFDRDITERKRDEETQAKLTEQLHQSQKMDAIGQLAGGVAHDFNNLLAGIMGSVQMLQISENITEKQKKYISMILDAAERAGNLTKKLLTFSRNSSKASTAVDCVKIINDTAGILQHTIDRKITVTIENLADQTLIIGDDSLLLNTFINMGINASQAMTNGGKLTFTLENTDLDKNYCDASPFDIRPGYYLKISVRDTGSGIPPEILHHIFEPFFTTKEPGRGTGLGLAMVYGTVQEHGGAITVYSEPGTGTVFHIYFPVAEGQLHRESPHEELPEGTGTILLIDDEDLIRITARGLLESLGYMVLLSENGEEGIKTFTEKKEEIHLIILDMIMPVMGGREAFMKLREIDPDIPVLITSGFAGEEHMNSLKERGISGFLQKPFRTAELAVKVSRALKK